MDLDHERLDVYRVSVEFAAWAYGLCRPLRGSNRHARAQLLRASQSIALNIAEGCGKMPSADRARFLEIAGGSARECAAILDILGRCAVVSVEERQEGKDRLVRIVAMLTKMVERCRGVREQAGEYENGYDGDGYVYGDGGDDDRVQRAAIDCSTSQGSSPETEG